MAAAAGAPVRVPDAVMEQLAVPVAGEDLLTPFLDRVPPFARALPGHDSAGGPMALPGQRPRFEPRNLHFADGLDRWDLESGSGPDTGPSRPVDYSAAADGQSAVLSSAVRRPAGSAALVQTIFADDYRGATMVFRGEIRTQPLTELAGVRLEVFRHWWRTGLAPEEHRVTVSGGSPWTGHEITALVPEDADLIRFGIILAGPGQVALRNPELRTARAASPSPGGADAGAGKRARRD
jgi:hypothetical protein